jgi:HSP20 family protein
LTGDGSKRAKDCRKGIDLPGINTKDLTVEIREGSLCVSGERKAVREEKGKTHYCCERAEGRFNRVIPLNLPVDRDKVDARYHDGILTITVAKKAPAEIKRIEIKT